MTIPFLSGQPRVESTVRILVSELIDSTSLVLYGIAKVPDVVSSEIAIS